MEHSKKLCLILTCLIAAGGCKENRKNEYPISKQLAFSETKHGETIEDPFRWLEEMDNAEVSTWVQAQDQFLKKQLHDDVVRPMIHKRISELKSYPSYTSPVKRGANYYFTKTEANQSRANLYLQHSLQENPVPIFKPAQVFSDSLLQIHSLSGGNSLGYEPSPDGNKMLLSISDGRSRWYSVQVFQLPSMMPLQSDSLSGLHNLSGVPQWSNDNAGFFYVRFDVPAKGENLLKAPARNPRVLYHKLGTSADRDEKIFSLNNAGHNWLYNLSVTSDGKYLVIDIHDGSKIENMIYLKPLMPSTAVIPFLTKMDANYSFLGSRNSDLFFYTTLGAPRGKIIAVDAHTKQIRELVGEAEETISGGSVVGGNAIGFYGNKFLVTYIKHGVPVLKGFDMNGKLLYTSSLPIDGSIWGGFAGTDDSEEVFFNFLGFTSPSTIYRIDAATGALHVFQKSEIPFDTELYITKQVFYPSKDGTKIPMFITHKKGLVLDGKNPALMYAYGAAGWISFLWYQEHLLAWLELGGVYAQPSIRGGGEYGEAWHAAGVLLNRQNAVDDFHAAAEYLINNNYTSPKHLAANGGSLSSALAGTAVMQRPELFGAMILDRPVLDLVHYTEFNNGSSWIGDLGDPTKKAEFDVLYKMSPYHQIKKDQCYPATLIMVGDKDQVTPPAHAYKFTARMQENRSCSNPVFLKMMWETGHSFGSTPAQSIDSRTDEIMFLLKVFNIEIPKRNDRNQ
jgi:prolyl oligopeptidase